MSDAITRYVTVLLSALCLLAAEAVAQANDSGIDPEAMQQKLAEMIARNKQKQSAGQSGNLPGDQSPLLMKNLTLNATNQAEQQRAISEYFRHVTETNQHQRDVFRWQLLSSRVIFAAVLLLVLVGVYFAARQFHKDLQSGKQGTVTTIKAGSDGVEVSSSVLGVIILVISLLFFYLYLVYVYPIEFVK